MMLYYILFHFDVSLQMSLIKISIFLEKDWNNLSLHGVVMFWTVVPFFCETNAESQLSPGSCLGECR